MEMTVYCIQLMEVTDVLEMTVYCIQLVEMTDVCTVDC